MLNIPQYPTYDSLPSGSHGDLAEVTTGGVGVYKFVGQVNREPVGFWVPADLADRIVDYVRRELGLASVEITDGGTGYNANDQVEPSGGTSASEAILTVDTVDNGAITAASITYIGAYTADPTPLAANPVITVIGTGTGAEFNIIMQNQSGAAKISVGIGGDLVADCVARGWFTTITGNGVFPVDATGAIECDSGATLLGQSGFVWSRLLDIGATAKEYLVVSQTDTTAGTTDAFLMTSLWGTTGNKVIRQSFRKRDTDNVAYLAYSSGSSTPLVGRNYLPYSSYETVFSHWSNGPVDNANAETFRIWKSSEGQVKTNPNALLEEFTAATGNRNLILRSLNYVGDTGCIGRVREFHLFELS